MARKIRFPLIMKNGAEVRSLEELQENFDLESVIGCFTDGKLQTWLADRYYDEKAEAVSQLSSDMADLNEKLCEILEVGYSSADDDTDIEVIQRRNEKLTVLRQAISDDALLEQVDIIALDQDDLYDILDTNTETVYLYGEKFTIPTQKKNVKYIGINNPLVLLGKMKTSVCAENGISFENVRFEDGADDDNSIASLMRRAEKGNAEAQFELGTAYYNGDGMEQNYEKAFEWYTKAAEQGMAEAQFKLGICYDNGQGVTQNYKKAVEWFTKAAEQGFAEAQYNLGNCYYNGQGVRQNYKKAIEWFTKAAEQGYAYAQYNLGTCYDNGQGVTQNHKKAVEWYTKAAEQGDANAQNNLGACYDNGQGVRQNYKKAAERFTKAAEQGDAMVQFNLGDCYYNGQGVRQNYKKAVEWYTKAAEQGYADAQNNLGICYNNGRGVTQNYKKAIEWITKAAEQGDENAIESLKLLKKSFKWFFLR